LYLEIVMCIFTPYTCEMIKTIKSKALSLLWEKGDGSKLPSTQLKKIKLILQIIDELEEVPEDLKHLVSFRPHPLKANYKGYWSLDVTGNYRVIFRFENKNALDLDYLDTH
jgi:proteic killer suppression protein